MSQHLEMPQPQGSSGHGAHPAPLTQGKAQAQAREGPKISGLLGNGIETRKRVPWTWNQMLFSPRWLLTMHTVGPHSAV